MNDGAEGVYMLRGAMLSCWCAIALLVLAVSPLTEPFQTCTVAEVASHEAVPMGLTSLGSITVHGPVAEFVVPPRRTERDGLDVVPDLVRTTVVVVAFAETTLVVRRAGPSSLGACRALRVLRI